MFDYSTLTAFPMKRIFYPKLAAMYELGSMESRKVKSEFQFSASESFSSFLSGPIARMVDTTFMLETPPDSAEVLVMLRLVDLSSATV